MSNPAVQNLAGGKIGKINVNIEDNVGESIHIHMDNIRVDLTVEKFDNITSIAKKTIDDIIDVKGFSCDILDPIFLSTITPWLIDLEKVKIDKIKLSDIKVNIKESHRKIKYVNLLKSKNYLGLGGDYRLVDRYNSSDHINQTGRERLKQIYESIEKNGYPFNNKLMVFFNDSNVIRDGQHRAASLLFLKGNIEVPILRLYFKNNKYSYEYLKKCNKIKNQNFTQIACRVKYKINQVSKKIMKIKQNIYELKNRKVNEEYFNIRGKKIEKDKKR